MSKEVIKKKDTKLLDRILNSIENAGNALPDPIIIFAIISVLVLIASWIVSSTGVTVIHPSTKEEIGVINLLTRGGLQKVLMNFVKNFQGYPPLGLVLVVMLGAGLAEKSGLITAAMKQSISKIQPQYVSAAVILIGIVANAFGDAGFIVLPPLAAMVYLLIGRHPLVGMFAAYAGVAGGFAANIMVNMSDVLVASFTIPAAQVVYPEYKGTPAMNLYFIAVSVIILVIVGTLITEKIISPRFGKYECDVDMGEHMAGLTDNEKKGLKWAGISFAVMLVILVGLSIGKNAFMADPATGSILAYESPLMQSIVPIITIVFFVPGFIFGKITGVIKTDRDLAKMLGESMKDMGPYIVLAFVASQFLAYFNWSNLGIVMSVKGAEALSNSGFGNIGLIIGFIIFSSIINIFVGSASAKWAIMAPIFVPMFMLLGFDPALSQMAYRIGDSVTNAITPLFPYFPILLSFAKKYDKNAGMGTMISSMLPYSIGFFLFWTVLLIIFIVFKIPLGPGGGIYYTIP